VASAAVGTGLENYTITYVDGTFTVTQKALTITADNQGKVYGEVFTFDGDEFTAVGLVNSDAVTSVTLVSDGAPALATVAGSPYAIVASAAVGTGLENYTITYVDGTFTVTQKALTITADNQGKVYGEVFTFDGDEFTAVGLVNSDAITSVTLLPADGAPAAATVAGSPYAIVASAAVGTGLENYTITYVDGTFTVTQKALTITADNQGKVYGEVFTFDGDEFTAVGLVNSDAVTSVTLVSDGAPAAATVAGSPYAIVASAAVGTGLENYTITYVDGTFTVTQKALTITANNQGKVYGEVFTFDGDEFTAVGLVNSDAVTSVTLVSDGAPALATVAGSPYAIVASAAVGTGLENYTITYVDGTFTVTQKALTITANNQGKVYGEVFTFDGDEFTAVGLVNSDAITSVTLLSDGAPALATVAGSPYAIVASAAVGTGLENYTITYVDGTFTVTQKALTITADNQGKVYGEVFTFDGDEFTAVGLVNSDAITSVTLLSDGAPAAATVAGSPYAIVASAAVGTGLENYTITYVDGTFTVTQKALTITADNQVKNCAQPDPVFTVTYDGFVNSEDDGILNGDLAFSRESGELTGTYIITASGLTSTNYNIIFIDGTLTINTNQETILVDNTDAVLCFNSSAIFDITLEENVLISGAERKYQVEIVYSEHVKGIYGNEFETVIVRDLTSTGIGAFQDILSNTGNSAETITYTFTPYILLPDGTSSCSGISSVIFSIQVNPLPKVVAAPDNETICNDGTTGITLTTPTTVTTGAVTFDYTAVASHAGVTGFTASATGLPGGHVIADVINNNTDATQTVTYTITPRSLGTGCADGDPITVVVTINPTPVVVATPTAETICNDGVTGITLTTPTTVTSGVVTFDYTAVASHAGVTGFTATATGLTNGHVIADIINNNTDAPQTVTYTITPRSIDTGCDDGDPITVVVTINPTPVVVATPTAETICNDGVTDITLTTPTTVTSGVVTFDYTAVASHAGVTGFTATATGLTNGHVIADIINNNTDAPQTVTYTITPRSIDTGCDDGDPITVVVTINPTPKVVATPDTEIICNDGVTDITLTTPTTVTSGVVTFDYTAVASHAGVTGFTATATGLTNGHVIADIINNNTDAPQTVTYTITPRSIDTGCDDGDPITVVVTINPTPKVVATPDTEIICNNGTTGITLTTPTTVTSGVVTFDYTAVASHAGVTGFTATATGLTNGHVIADIINNNTDAPQTVTYTITPRSIDTGCDDGDPITVVVTINPTPVVVATPTAETICNDGVTGITLTTPTTVTSGVVTFDYTAVASHAGVTGFTATATGLTNGHAIADIINNNTDAPQTVTYTITPRSIDTGCDDGDPITVVVTINPTPVVVATPTAETICNDGVTGITLTTPTTVTSGVVTFDYTAVASHAGVTGFTATATGLTNGHVITDIINNNTDAPQTVTYTITPRSNDTGCDDGDPITVVVTINPTPVVVATPTAETICNDGVTGITLTTPTIVTSGVVTFDYTAVASHAGVTGFTATATGLTNGHVIADIINNNTDAPQTVTYTITPRSIDTGCDDGAPITVVVTINPTPVVVATPTAETICNDGTTGITLTTPTTVTSGVVTFDYTAVASHAGVTGFTATATGLTNGHVIADIINNNTDAPQTVTYTITPRSIDTGCDDGDPITVVVTINPTPKVVATPDTEIICNDGVTDITLTTPTTVTSGVVTFDYTAVASHAGVTGFTATATGLTNGHVIADIINNNTDAPQTVTYTITPRSIDTGCDDGDPITVVVTINPTPKVVATPDTEIICNDGVTDITLTTPTTVTSGVVTFDYTAVASHAGVTGFTATATGLTNGHVIADIINNNTDAPQTVTYTITPRSIDTGCDDGDPITVVVTINPTRLWWRHQLPRQFVMME
jgi:hypothetical protein